jgi:hypothetical protein
MVPVVAGFAGTMRMAGAISAGSSPSRGAAPREALKK